MGKQVRDVMTSEVRSASPSQSLADAAELMKSEDVGSLLVTEQDRLIGIVTDRDIDVRAVAERRDPREMKVEEVITRDPVIIEPEQDLDEALSLMARNQIRRLPVVEDGRLVGIVAQADLGLGATKEEVGETVEEISRPALRRAA
jgi:CBS domain-containing protein